MQKLFREIGFACLLLVLALLLVFSLFWALSIGTVKLPIREIYETVLAQFTSGESITAPGQGPVHDIVWLLRLPRVILASLVGCGLAVCGAFSSFIVYFANNKEGMQTIAYWMMGSLAGAKWGELAIIAPIIMASTLCGGRSCVFSSSRSPTRGRLRASMPMTSRGWGVIRRSSMRI